MSRSSEQCAADRAEFYGNEIQQALSAADSRKALRRSYDYLLAEAAKRRDRHPGDGALIDAALAGILWQLAATVPEYLPRRPARRALAPSPDDLLAAFAHSARRDGGEAP
jgi:hypothetical protein